MPGTARPPFRSRPCPGVPGCLLGAHVGKTCPPTRQWRLRQAKSRVGGSASPVAAKPSRQKTSRPRRVPPRCGDSGLFPPSPIRKEKRGTRRPLGRRKRKSIKSETLAAGRGHRPAPRGLWPRNRLWMLSSALGSVTPGARWPLLPARGIFLLFCFFT